MVDTTFTDALASKDPVPGGGGASAYAGALAAALGSMVAHLTIGKKKFLDRDAELKKALADFDACRAELLDLIDADAEAFAKLAATWKLPKETEEQQAVRHGAEQRALVAACDVPMRIMHACARVIEVDAYVAHNGSHLALSDAGAAAVLAKAALEAASLNVYINTSLMDDEAAALALERESDALIAQAGRAADEVSAFVRAQIRR
ncbi:MAG: cyclodeaminase/cyclohydrolase family protein [Slackia sp.]|nr:cyclodeaminase/cyclohydrolase family protein [Slackia sp.]